MAIRHVEKMMEGSGGVRLFTQSYELDRSNGTVIIVHGYCEHSLRYGHVVNALTEAGYNVYLFDQRGHGKSDGPRAAVLRFEEYLEDMDVFLEQVRKSYGEGPLFLLGHSMGGLVVAHYTLSRRPDIAGVVLSSPYLGLKVKVPAWKEALARVTSRLVPSLSLKSEIDPHLLSHDGGMVEEYISDPAVSKLNNARWYTESSASQDYCQENARSFPVPMLLMHGGDDRIADPDASRRFFKRVGREDSKLVIHEGFFHEIFNETGRDVVLAMTVEWLNERIGKE